MIEELETIYASGTFGDAVVRDGEVYTPTYDANGNISEYLDSDCTIIAHQEYDPFGNTIISSGDTAAFTHWFSTKPWCGVTGMVEYQFRKYRPGMGRWMIRDPSEEYGDIGLFRFCQNSGIASVDCLGNEFFPKTDVWDGFPLVDDDKPQFGYLWGFHFNDFTDIPEAFYNEIKTDFGPVFDVASEAAQEMYEGIKFLGDSVVDFSSFMWRLPTEISVQPLILVNYLFGAEKWHLTLCMNDGELREVDVFVGGIVARNWALTPSYSTIFIGEGILEKYQGKLDVGLSDPSILNLLRHEGGHTLQASLLGPFYHLLVVPFTGWSYDYKYFNWAEEWATHEGSGLSFPGATKP